jgi:hypothetical protein
VAGCRVGGRCEGRPHGAQSAQVRLGARHPLGDGAAGVRGEQLLRRQRVSQSSIGDEVEQRTQKLSSQEPSRRDPTSNVAHRGAVNGRTDARGVSANSSLV